MRVCLSTHTDIHTHVYVRACTQPDRDHLGSVEGIVKVLDQMPSWDVRMVEMQVISGNSWGLSIYMKIRRNRSAV